MDLIGAEGRLQRVNSGQNRSEEEELLLLRQRVWGVTGYKFGVLGGRCGLRWQTLIHDHMPSNTKLLTQNRVPISQGLPAIFQNCEDECKEAYIRTTPVGRPTSCTLPVECVCPVCAYKLCTLPVQCVCPVCAYGPSAVQGLYVKCHYKLILPCLSSKTA